MSESTSSVTCLSSVRNRVDMTIRKIGPFEIERQIGVGGMGLVYSAIYPKNGKRVAVKILSPGLMTEPKLLKRFEREIEILKRLNHPNIVKYYGGGSEENQRYYAMEFIDGGSLQQVLKDRGRLSWDKALHVGRQVSSALEHAHNAGIIHRDLKPANLFLSRKGRLKLGDFGIARDTEATALTAAGKTVGTYAYMAPEQIQAGIPITGKTDLYALGCLLYEIIVGETPFQSENPMDMLMQHLNDDPYDVCEHVPDCPIELDRLIGRLLAKDPDDRPYDALAVHTELGEIREALKGGKSAAVPEMIGSAGSSVKPEKGQVPAGKAKSRKKKKKKKKRDNVPFHERTWFLVTCLVALLGATAWLLRPHSEDWYPDQWREGMRGDEYAQRESLEYHIDAYLEKFPDGKYADEARDLSDEIHANILEDNLKHLAKFDKPVEPPFKADCVDAVRQEDEAGLTYVYSWQEQPTGELKTSPLATMERWYRLIQRGQDLLKQIQRFNDSQAAEASADSSITDSSGTASTDEDAKTKRQMLMLATDEPQIRWLTKLALHHHDFFRSRLLESSRARRFLRERMMKAEELFAEEDDLQRQEALLIWDYCYRQFNKVEWLEDFAEYARLRMNGSDADVPAIRNPGETSDASSDSDNADDSDKPDET